jgi:transposase-like protein
MRPHCRKCELASADGSNFVLSGKYYRQSDSKWVQRYRCRSCKVSFSTATHSPCFRQKKRHKNEILRKLLCSGVSQRRSARILRLHRTTVVRKFLFLALEAEFFLMKGNLLRPQAKTIEFDDLETFEHTKCKPLSVTLAVESKTRRILGLEVTRMPARGMLVKAAKKYGPRADERTYGRKRLFRRIQSLVAPGAEIRSDSNPHYPPDVARFFPGSPHKRYLGKRGSLGGQGELKKLRFDPLFSLNHTCAKLRADINRLFRRTWCTTKRSDRLYAHLILYAHYHNQHLPA